MSSLKAFEQAFLTSCQKNKVQLTISGCAVLQDITQKCTYSVSCISEEGFPEPCAKNIAAVTSIMQNISVCGFRFHRVMTVRALVKEDEIRRWQVQYSIIE